MTFGEDEEFVNARALSLLCLFDGPVNDASSLPVSRSMRTRLAPMAVYKVTLG